MTGTHPDLPNFDKLWDFRNPDKTEIAFRDIFAGDAVEAPLPYRAELLTQIARTLGLQRKFAEADQVLDEVEVLLPQATPRARVRYLLERGRVLNSSGNKEKARIPFAEAMELANQCGEENLAIDAVHMLAITEEQDAALVWNELAVTMCEAAQDPNAKNWLGSLYNNIGWTYFAKRDYEKALDYFTRDRIWFEERGRMDQEAIARWSMARMYRALGRCEEAFAMQEDIERYFAKKGEPDGYVYEELGECAASLGHHPGEVRQYFSRALELLLKDVDFVNSEPIRLARLRAMVMPAK